MNRRHFLQAGVATLAGHWLAAHAGTLDDGFAAPDWKLGWRGTRVDRFAPLSMDVDGNLPGAVRGSLFRNGPARIERAGVRYRHWFDGDGMVQHFRLDADKATHEARFVQTAKYVEEQAAGRFLYGGAGTVLPEEKPSRNNDTGNVANTSMLYWDNELLALWEGGSAYQLDPGDLSTIGRKDWREDLVHMPFSAHPLAERDGTLWNFGSMPYAGGLFIYRLAPGAGVQQVAKVELPVASYMHSFAMTERFLVFYVSPHRYQFGAETFVDSFEWAPELGSRILLVDKNDLDKRHWFEAPAGFVFHFAHAFEAGNEVIARLALYPTAQVMSDGMKVLMQSDSADTYPDYPRARLTTLRLNLVNGRLQQEDSGTLIEFPGVDSRHANQSTAVFGVGHASDHDAAYSNAVVRVDPDSGKTTRYAFPPHHVVEEPLFVADNGRGSPSGWLVGTCLDYASRRSGVYVLDADDLAAGPVAMATMDRHLPLGFHGCFVPSLMV